MEYADEILASLSKVEGELCKIVTRVEIQEKRSRKVAVLFPNDIK